MMISLKSLLLVLVSCFQLFAYGQLSFDDVKMEKIHQRKIRKYIEACIEGSSHRFAEIHPSWKRGKDLSLYSKNEMVFCVKGKLQDVWQGYVTANPSKSWNGNKVSFGLLVQKFPGTIYYNNDSIMGVDTGQVYFLNLKLLLGLYKVPVAFEMITVNENEKLIEFSYIEGNISSGVQQIKFMDIGGNRTLIVHSSYFKSKSKFRDKNLYPFFHEKIVYDFHRNMRKLLHLKTASMRAQKN